MNISNITSILGKTRQGISTAVSMTYMITRYYLGIFGDIPPSAVIAGIPLATTIELSHGISDREVRYRSSGGVFLAHQSGGNESLRIIGQAWGPNRFIFLTMLEFLFIYGSSKVVDVLGGLPEAFPGQGNVVHKDGSELKTTDPVGIDPWEEVKLANISEGYKEQHLTFPVITKDRIYLSMYIETYTWRQRVDVEGRKMVEYTIFFRKYEPDDEYEYGVIETPPKKEEEAPGTMKVYRNRDKNENSLFFVNMKSGLEIALTLAINFGTVYNISDVTRFGQQFQMNYFGIDSQKGRIPGIIETRGFF